VTFLLRDLLDDVKKHHQVLDFVTKMCCVKPFEAIGNQLKDHLMNESILCMNGTLRAVHDQQKEIARMKHFMNSMKDMSVLDSPKGKICDTQILKFFTLASNLQKKVPNHLLFMWIALRIVIWQLSFKDLSQSENFIEIKSPFTPIY
jgi:hypothetical protein